MRPCFLAAITIVALAAVAGRPEARQAAPARPPDVVYQPTPQTVVDAMLDLAGVTSDDVVYDLGSGDGRIPITAARRFGARAVGVEIDPELLRLARANLDRAGLHQLVTFRNEDLFETSIHDATVVALYLLPKLNVRLIPKLKRELVSGSRVVSYQWDMGPPWRAERTRSVPGGVIYLWTID
jgi:tRNA A58 N-methylase Trm61